MISRKSVVSLLLLASLFCIRPGACETGVTDKEILLGVSNVQSGSNEFYGKQTTIGFKALMDAVNEKGGINGRKIRVITEDDRYEPDGAISCFQKLVSQGVFGIGGIVGSTCLARYLPMAMNFKVPVAGYYAGPIFAGEPVKRYCFTARASYRDEVKAQVDHLWNDLHIRRIAVIYQNDPFGADLLEGVKQELQKYGSEVVAAGSYTRNQNNIAEAVEAVKKADPEAVILAAVYNPCAQVVKLAKETKWNPIFVINSGSGVDVFITEAGANAEGIILSEVAPPPSRIDLPLIKAYLSALKQYYPKEKPNFVSLRGYIDGLIFIEGLKHTGKDLTRDKFVDALEKIHHEDVGLGKGMALNYSPTDHLGFHNVFWGVIRNGEVVSFSDWKKLGLKKKEI